MGINLIRTVLGPVPSGFEWMEYIFGGLMFIMVLRALLSMFYMIAGFFPTNK